MVQMAVSCLRIRAELGLDHRQDTGGTPANEDEAVFSFLRRSLWLCFYKYSQCQKGATTFHTSCFTLSSSCLLSSACMCCKYCFCWLDHHVHRADPLSCVTLAGTSRPALKLQDFLVRPSCQSPCPIWPWHMAARWHPRGEKWLTRT